MMIILTSHGTFWFGIIWIMNGWMIASVLEKYWDWGKVENQHM